MAQRWSAAWCGRNKQREVPLVRAACAFWLHVIPRAWAATVGELSGWVGEGSHYSVTSSRTMLT